jgi:hypothetical protein
VKRALSAVAIAVCLAASSARADTPAPDPYLELWPELDVYYRIDPAFRTLVQVGPVFIPKDGYSEFNVGTYIDAFTFPLLRQAFTNDDSKERLLSLRVGATYTQTLEPGDLSTSQVITLPWEVQGRYRLPLMVLVSLRNRWEERWRLLDDPVFMFRYRLRPQIEQEFRIGGAALTPYVNSELFWSTPGFELTHLRVQGGATLDLKLFARGQAIELYYLRIFDLRAGKPDSNVVGLALHFYF